MWQAPPFTHGRRWKCKVCTWEYKRGNPFLVSQPFSSPLNTATLRGLSIQHMNTVEYILTKELPRWPTLHSRRTKGVRWLIQNALMSEALYAKDVTLYYTCCHHLLSMSLKFLWHVDIGMYNFYTIASVNLAIFLFLFSRIYIRKRFYLNGILFLF